MTKTKLLDLLLPVCLALGSASFAQADLIVTPVFDPSNQVSAPDTTDYEGVFYDESSAFPPNPITIGTFNFTVPTGEQVTGATISGTFGDVNYLTTAPADLFVNNGAIQVAACDVTGGGTVYPTCATGTIDNTLVPWSYTFTAGDLTSLAASISAGTLDFTAVQDPQYGFGSVVIGNPTLNIQTTPEPASLVTLFGGLLAVAAARRRHSHK